MATERILEIDGKRVAFRVDSSGQAMAVPHDYDPSKLPPNKLFLAARVGPAGSPEWAGNLKDLEWTGTTIDNFSDEELHRLYHQKRPKSLK